MSLLKAKEVAAARAWSLLFYSLIGGIAFGVWKQSIAAGIFAYYAMLVVTE